MPSAVYICPLTLGGCGYFSTGDEWSVNIVPSKEVLYVCPKCGKSVGRFLTDSTYKLWVKKSGWEEVEKLLDKWRESLSGDFLLIHWASGDIDESKLSDFQLRQFDAYDPDKK